MKKLDEVADYMLALVERNGAACASVSDGHVLVFRRDTLERLLADNDADLLSIFVKTTANEMKH
jgi:hypothetical protein